MNSICFNGKIVTDDEPVLMASNRGYRYGDGLFETMKVLNGNILLRKYHFERLFSGLSIMKFEIPVLFTEENIEEELLHLSKKNNCEKLGRVRLSVSRGNGGLYDDKKNLQYLIECWPLNESVNKLNENGLVIGIYPDAEKSCDKFSNLKSANFLPYSMAALFAKENKWNDCLVLNTTGGIADSTIANVFIIKENSIITPGLEEGCVNGVMRKYVIEKLRGMSYELREGVLTVNDLEDADEVFLTNAVNGIRWVRQFADKIYTNVKTVEIYNRFIKGHL
jgi:branched-chain amino acid aminotransferase